MLPFLLGDRLVARVDFEADRPGDACWYARPTWRLAPAAWLGPGAVSVGRRGDLARRLAAAARR